MADDFVDHHGSDLGADGFLDGRACRGRRARHGCRYCLLSNLLITADHSNNIDVGNQVINRLWQECCALAFLLIYDVVALPTVFL